MESDQGMFAEMLCSFVMCFICTYCAVFSWVREIQGIDGMDIVSKYCCSSNRDVHDVSMQEEVQELRTRLRKAEEMELWTTKELSTKNEEIASAKVHHAMLTTRIEEMEVELRLLNESSSSMTAELRSSVARANELESSVARVAELDMELARLEDEKKHLVAAADGQTKEAQAKIGEVGCVVSLLQEEKGRALENAEQAHRERAEVFMELTGIASSLG